MNMIFFMLEIFGDKLTRMILLQDSSQKQTYLSISYL